MLKRPFDLLVTLLLMAMLVIPVVVITLLVRLTSSGPAIYWSDRVGRGNRIFKMPKFRSMHIARRRWLHIS
jgi:O-antigen biosynthesis protein WbqP